MISYSIDNLNENKVWDCIIVGGGPAGAMSAYRLAKNNKDVLLIDKSTFPRAKVCGCCINGSALEALKLANLDNLLEEKSALKLDTLRLFNNKKSCDIILPESFSLSRETFDSALVKAANDCGANISFGIHAKIACLEPFPIVCVEKNNSKKHLRTKIVIVADGLSGGSLDQFPQFNASVKKNSRFGASIILDRAPAFIESGKIYMACGNGGYVGMVLLEDGRLNLAAALSYEFSRHFSGPGPAITSLLQDNALPLPGQLAQERWTGTNALTRFRTQVSGHRLFIVGDACGYSEPFTGEGMSWALWSGLSVADFAIDGINQWQPQLSEKWRQTQSELNKRRKRSHIIASALRNNFLRNAFINISTTLPGLLKPFIKNVNSKPESMRGLI